MAETIREMVVRLSMDAGAFRKTANDIKGEIRKVDSEIRAIGTASDEKVRLLEDKLTLQKSAVDNFKTAVEQARANLDSADSAADKLLAAKRLSQLQTDLNNAETAAKNLQKQLDLMKWDNLNKLGGNIRRIGRNISLYISGPLAALGITSMNTYKEYEMASAVLLAALDNDMEGVDRLTAAAQEMSETIPVSYREIMAMMTSLAKAGVPVDNIEEMTLVMAQLSATTGMSADTVTTEMVKFMNAFGLPLGNIDQLSSALILLADQSIAAEEDIFSMASRMAATGNLAGFSATDVLSLAAAFSSMSINAEAGGSAAGKLMRRMQGAAELGTKAMDTFAGATMTADMSIRDIELAADNAKWLTGLADQLAMTKEEVQGLIDAAVGLNQFSEVMGIAPGEFVAGWNENPAQSILNFFQGLKEIDTEGVDSVLTWLDAMDLAEIRLGNLIGVGASNPTMFEDLLDTGKKGFEENTALAEKAGTIFSTTSGELDVMANKMENASADMGENVADALTPIMDTVSNLVSKFGELDEATQTRWVTVAGALVALGPVATGIGTVASGVAKIGAWATKIKARDVDNVSGLVGALTSPAGAWLLVGAGLVAAVVALESIQSPVDRIVESLGSIKVELDEETYSQTTAALADLKAQSDALSGQTGEYNKNLSTAVKAGYGTGDMYGTALGYEARLTEREIADIAGRYAENIDRLNGLIGAETDAARQKALADQRDATQRQWDAEVAQAKARYMAQVSALVAGMMQSRPEAKAALEQAAIDYDLLAELERVSMQVMNEDDNAVIDALWAGLFTQDVRSKYFNGQSLDSLVPSTAVQLLRETLMNSLKTSLETAGGEDSFAYTLLQTILSDPLTSGMYDATLTTGALDGLVELLDFAAAAEKAGTDFGTALTPGLADAITGALPDSLAALQSLGEQLATEAGIQAAAVSAAWNAGLIFNAPNPGGGTPGGGPGGGVNNTNNNTININGTPATGPGIYGIQRELTNAIKRTARGYGKS